MSEHNAASARGSDEGNSRGRWVDMMEVERVLTPVREREQNIGGPCEPAFICFAFAPCEGEATEEDEEEDLSEGDEEEGMRTPRKKRRDQEGLGSVSKSSREGGMISPPTSAGKRKRYVAGIDRID